GRTRKDCPVPGCTTKQLVRLPLHLSQVHKVNGESKKRWLNDNTETTLAPRHVEEKKTSKDAGGEWWKTQSLTPFEPCSSICISGPTGVGKTRWVYMLLRHLEGMYIDPPTRVMYCYGVYQPLFDEIEREIDNLTLCQGLPTQSEIEEFADGRHGLIVLDDLCHAVLENRDMELLFTQGCHHRRLSVIFITQNLYAQGKSARTIALNVWYLVLFKNVRDKSQIATLGRQLYPGRTRTLTEAYEDCMREPYAYLVVDMSPSTDDKRRLRTRIFPNQDPVIYVPKSL
ncbi:hypothetical protein BOW31_12855, partial [Solemya velum gill symbiont]